MSFSLTSVVDDGFSNRFPCVLVTGKGQPDVATRLLLKRLATEFLLPILALTDADPYGLSILSVYTHGSEVLFV